MKRRALKILLITLITLYIIISGLFYFTQEKAFFDAPKLDSNFEYSFTEPFEEINIKTKDGINLNTLLFKADSTKGVVLFFRGSGGTLDHWAKMAPFYLENNYDLFLAEYRGYSKSEGSISSQEQFNSDMQTTYDFVKTKYPEDKIIVIGYSMGSGPAAYIASKNKPKHLVLFSPYFSFSDLILRSIENTDAPPAKLARIFPISLLLRYEFNTSENIKHCKMPVTIYHGDKDDIIPLDNAIRLKENFKQGDRLIILENQEHNHMPKNLDLQKDLKELLIN